MARRKWFSFESREPYPESEGVNDAWWVTHLSLGKEANGDSPYLIPNEWIAGNIASFLRLPIPPFALVQSGPTTAMFDSLRFGRKETRPKDMQPLPCIRNDPKLCTGILLFDIFVANGDRHRGNLKVDDPNDPKDFNVFDHDRALLGTVLGGGAQRLTRTLDELGVSAGGGLESRNCFLETLNTSDFFEHWIHRIELIPDWFIDEICDEANYWLDAAEIESAKMFLKYRKCNLRPIVKAHKSSFTSISDWGLFYDYAS